MLNFYEPSGKTSPTAYLLLLGLILTAFPILGLIYAYAIWYIPFIYINFIIAGLLGIAVGFVIRKVVVRFGKVRSVMMGTLFGLIAGLATMYFHWAAWIDLVINADGEGMVVGSNVQLGQVFALITNPSTLFTIIGEVNEHGTWGFKGGTVSGTFLTIIWIIELLIVVGVATLTAGGDAAKPFCEKTNTWFEEKALPKFKLIEDMNQFVSSLQEGKANELFSNLERETQAEVDHCLFTLFSSGQGESYISITNVIGKKDDEGKLEWNDVNIVEFMEINEELKQTILSK